MTKPTDSLIERIDTAIERFRPVFGDSTEANAICEEIYEFLTDFRNRLSPPVIEGELEIEYDKAIDTIKRVVQLSKTLTALHDELGRVRDRLMQRELSLKQTDEWVEILFQELTETVKGSPMIEDEKKRYRDSLMKKHKYGATR